MLSIRLGTDEKAASCICVFFFFFLFFYFFRCTFYGCGVFLVGSRDPQNLFFLTKLSLKIGLMALFTHLKMILL